MNPKSYICALVFVSLLHSTAQTEEIAIGLITPLTGVRADAGNYSKNAALLAVKEINDIADQKYRLKLIIEDSKYNAKDAVSSFHRLKSVSGVDFVIGPYSSSSVLAVSPIAERSQTILIAPGAQSDQISAAGDYIFRVIHNARQEAPFFAKFIANQMSSDTIHFLALQTAFTDSYLKHFTPAFEKTGKHIGIIELYDPNTTDFRPPLLRIKNKQPECIFLVAVPTHAGHILRQAHEIGLNVQFYNIAVEGPELVRIAGVLSEGWIYPYSFDSQSSNAVVRNFVEKYEKLYSAEPDTVAANTYDSIKLLHFCMLSVGSAKDAVKDCLYSVKSFEGASGTFDIDKFGDAVKSLIIKRVQNGRFTKLSELN